MFGYSCIRRFNKLIGTFAFLWVVAMRSSDRKMTVQTFGWGEEKVRKPEILKKNHQVLEKILVDGQGGKVIVPPSRYFRIYDKRDIKLLKYFCYHGHRDHVLYIFDDLEIVYSGLKKTCNKLNQWSKPSKDAQGNARLNVPLKRAHERWEDE